MPRVLIIGANGQLGVALARVFTARADVIESDLEARPGQVRLDLGDPASVEAGLDATKPELILLAGALTHVDRCETEPDLCRRINTDGPRAVAEWARDHGARVVFYSTDQVFDGTKDPYVETDPINPLNVYARSKADTEEVLRAILPDRHLALRTAWVFGPDLARKNFAIRLALTLAAGKEVVVPADQWGTPTYTEDLAGATLYLLEQGRTGLFHAVGPDYLDRLSLSRRVCARFGLESSLVVPKTTQELRQPARRPLRVRLDCRKLHETGAPLFRGLDAGLDALHAWHRATAGA